MKSVNALDLGLRPFHPDHAVLQVGHIAISNAKRLTVTSFDQVQR